MSDSVKPQMHGRDHRIGGSDPLPKFDWCRIYINTSGTAPVFSGTSKVLTFGTIENTNDVLFSPTVGGIQVKSDGVYLLKGQTQWQTYGTVLPASIRSNWLVVNTDYTAVQADSPSPLDDFVMANGFARLNADDTVQLYAHQDSGFQNSLYYGDDGSSTNANQRGNFLELTFINMANPLPS